MESAQPAGELEEHALATALQGQTALPPGSAELSGCDPASAPRRPRVQVFANVAIVVLDEYTPAAESWFT